MARPEYDDPDHPDAEFPDKVKRIHLEGRSAKLLWFAANTPNPFGWLFPVPRRG